MPKVFVSGCYDMLYSGHVAFFQIWFNLVDEALEEIIYDSYVMRN
jgi:glycerol-3-phosphate cytidylyltransferase-like family protein